MNIIIISVWSDALERERQEKEVFYWVIHNFTASEQSQTQKG